MELEYIFENEGFSEREAKELVTRIERAKIIIEGNEALKGKTEEEQKETFLKFLKKELKSIWGKIKYYADEIWEWACKTLRV